MDVGAGNNHFRGMAMKKTNSRKGFVYTLFVISFLSSLMLFLSMQNSADDMSELAEKIRADEVVSFVRAVSDDVNRGAFISSKRALLSLDNSILEGNGTFPPEANLSVAELIINGTFNNGHSEIMENSTLVNWTDALKAISAEQRMNAVFFIESTGIFPASAFEVAFKNNISAYIYDPFTKIAYNKTIQSLQNVPIDQLEDPYIAIRSLGTVSNTFKQCFSLEGTSHGGAWTYGKVYASTQNDFGGGSSEQILVTDTIVGKSNYGNFNAVVTETESDIPAVSTYIVGVPAGTLSLSKNGSYAVISNNTFWLTNDTSCYFEAPGGPSFLDRLEGNHPPYTKYQLPGRITGLGSFIPTFSGGRVLDYEHYG